MRIAMRAVLGVTAIVLFYLEMPVTGYATTSPTLASAAPCCSGNNCLFLPSLFNSVAPSSTDTPIRFYANPIIPLPPDGYDAEVTPVDFNQDGHTDIVVEIDGEVYVSWGRGSWRFTEWLRVLDNVGDIAVADMNGDGFPDLILATDQALFSDDTDKVLIAYGECRFGLSTPIEIFDLGPNNLFMNLLLVEDVNKDGKQDLILYTTDGFLVTLARDSGFGEAQSAGLPDPNSGIDDAELGNLNGDEFPDLLIVEFNKREAKIYIGSASGDFSLTSTIDWSANSEDSLWNADLADINRDGLHDIVLLLNGRGDSDLLVYISQVQRQFSSPLVLSTGFEYGAGQLAVIDINQDSETDLVTASNSTNQAAIFYGDGTGRFAAPILNDLSQDILLDATANYGGNGAPDLVLSDEENLRLLPNGGQGYFLRDILPVDLQPSRVATGDINGDGRLDIITGNGISESIGVLLGQGEGQFGPPRLFGEGELNGGLAVGKLNQDNYADAVATYSDRFFEPNEMLIFHGGSQGELNLVKMMQVPVAAGLPTIGDMNGDGWPDLVLSRCDDFNLVREALVYLGGVDGNYSLASTHNVRDCVNGMSLVDLNLDGHLDFVYSYQWVANSTLREDGIGILYGDGQGNLGNSVHYARGTDFLRNLTVGNINGDNRPDAVVTSVGAKFDIYLGNGAGGLDLNRQLHHPDISAADVLLADLNSDGLSELIITDEYDDLVTVYPNRDGDYGAYQQWPAFTEVAQVAAGDFNEDGRLDLVTGSGDSRFDQVWLYLSQ